MANENGAAPVMKFDFDEFSAIEIGYFMQNVTGPENIQMMSKALTRAVKECPAEWGPKDDPATYENLSWRKVWKKLIFPALRDGLKNDESE